MAGKVLQMTCSLNSGFISCVVLPAQYKSLAKKESFPVMLLRVPAFMVSSEFGSSMTAHLTPHPNLASSGFAAPAEGFLPVSVCVLIFTAKHPSIFSNRVCVTVFPLLPVPVQNRHTLSGFPPINVCAAFLRKNRLVPSSGNTVEKNVSNLATGPEKSFGSHEKTQFSPVGLHGSQFAAASSSSSKNSARRLA
ncbi:unknown [Singapore grouper iridovirus]|uniref:Uncharacterized protein n=1 Tax=Singapore grouper iridovirus TaxID=262968 RepID=Q5YFL2_9VIRU|nr:hypothetical protein ORF053R [Singapore grouper iridovirus]AAS18068.1 unknown [Singapore grouper iridovirus]WAU86762.1 hypothetical protein ORF053R [Singapore grouper iridovirus]